MNRYANINIYAIFMLRIYDIGWYKKNRYDERYNCRRSKKKTEKQQLVLTGKSLSAILCLNTMPKKSEKSV